MTKSDKRKRRSAHDLYPVLEQRKNTFYVYAYAGNPETMVKIFKKNDKTQGERIFPASAENKYFSRISTQVFQDPDVIKKYGKNILVARTKHGFSQEKVAELIGIDHDAISKIEGGLLKKIDRNILVLLCGLFQVPPEDLLEIDDYEGTPKKFPMTFDLSNVSGKPQFIVNQLIGQEPSLLLAFEELARAPQKKQNKLSTFLRNTPKLKLLKSEETTALVKYPVKKSLANIGENVLGRKWLECVNTFGELGSSNMELLDVYTSVAAMDKQVYSDVLALLTCAGFWSPDGTISPTSCTKSF